MAEGYQPPRELHVPPDDRGTQQGNPNKPSWEKKPQDWQALLEQDYKDFYEGDVIRNNQDGSKTYLKAYRYVLGVSEQNYDQQRAEQMIPTTVSAGLELAIQPVLIPDAGLRGSDQKPVDDLWLVFQEKEGFTGLDNTQVGGEWQQIVDREIAATRQPFTVQRDEMYGAKSNPQEPINDLYTLINDSPYADALKQFPQSGSAPNTSSNTQ